MKRTRIKRIAAELPEDLARFASGADIYDSSCSPEARVYFIDKDGGYFLKCAQAGALAKEAEMTKFFHAKDLGAEVAAYITYSHKDLLLTRALCGMDCTHEEYLSRPEKLCDFLALELRKLHETDFSGCPVQDRTKEYLDFAEKNYRTGNYGGTNSSDMFGYRSAEEAGAILAEGKNALTSKVLLHGDYCLPNIILDGWKLSGFIDLGCGGVGDRHIDLFWGSWTLLFNLKTDKYRGRFLDAYGRDKADESILKIIAAAEVFG